MPELTSVLDRAGELTVLVTGDAVLDRWIRGTASRLAREGPVPVLEVSRTEEEPGGAANTALNVAALGAHCTFVSRVGDDEAGRALREQLVRRGVDDSHVLTDAAIATPVKQRLVADGAMLARFDSGRPGGEDPRITDELLAEIGTASAVLACDYGYGAATPALLRALRRNRPKLPIILDSRDLSRWSGTRPTAVVPSFAEAMRLVGADPPQASATRADVVAEQAQELLDRTGAAVVAVTLDRDGTMLLSRGEAPHRTYAAAAPSLVTTGAGDTFAAAFTVALAAGAHAADAVEVAQAAAAVVVRRPGTAVCTRQELLRELAASDGVLLPAEQVARRVDEERARHKRIVFTNGCFDVLHTGHVGYLQQARRLGDVLVVALNSDASVARLKGPDRPVNPLADRAHVIAALDCVDLVTWFDEETPQRLLELVRPDLYVKGGDYTPEMLPETETVRRLGGEVRIVDYVSARSTTALLERIRSSSR